MIRTRATTPDDRGRECDLLRPAQLAGAHLELQRGRAMAKFLRLATKAESLQIDWRRVPVAILGVLVIIAARVIIGLGVPWLPPLVGAAIFWGGIAILALGLRAMTRRNAGAVFARTAVSMGVCGSCAYTLENLPVEPDECIICPECGAAWKHWRVTRPHYGPPMQSVPPGHWWQRTLGLLPRDAQLLGRDARGAYFRLIDKRLRLMPEAARAELGADRVRQLRRTLARHALGWRWLVAMLPLGLSGLAIFGSVRAAIDERGSDRIVVSLVFGIIAAILGVVATVAVRGTMFSTPSRRGRIAAEAGICSGCGHGLTGARLDPDGCTVCRRCGAAWRIQVGPAEAATPPQTATETVPPAA